MARIIGVEVPPNKRIDIALRYIYGIGPSNSKVILAKANIDPSVRAKDLTEQQLSQIVHAIQDGKYVIEGDLRREIGMNLKRLQGIKSIAASGTCAVCRCAGSAPRPTRAPARGRARRWASSAAQPPRPASTDGPSILIFQLINPFTSTWLTKPKRNPLPRRKANPRRKPEASADKPADKPAGKPAAKPGGDSHRPKGRRKRRLRPQKAPRPLPRRPSPPKALPPLPRWRLPTAAELLADDMAGKKIVKAKGAKNIVSGIANILATFNNTLVSITDMQGHVIGWSSAGRVGFKGSRKSTAYAAQQVAQDAARQAMSHGMREIEVRVKGPGSGRESAIRAFQAIGLEITTIKDVTPVPHNGCRPRKKRRV